MVCKEDVVSWFKELESYKRIDAMCSLLNMCLPFELRFIGTYLEELGKRDFQELRGAELRANSNVDLATDIGGATTDHGTRRKMALYVSLLRSCNCVCATTLYNVMVRLEQGGLLGGVYGDPLEELLLLYTMALHHPAFTFDQHTHFGEILEKLKLEDQRNHYNPPLSTVNTVPSSNSCIMNTNLSVPPPSVSGLTSINSLVIKTSPLQGQPVNSEQINEIVNQSVGVSNAPIQPSNEPMYSMMPAEPMPPPIGLPHCPMADYVIGQGHWPQGLIMTSINQPVDILTYHPPAGSPLISQPSSPCDSRAGSPRSVAPAPAPTLHMPPPAPPRLPRRPSQDSTPPPPSQQIHQQQQIVEHQQLQLVPGLVNMTLNERHTEEKLDDPETLQMKAMQQLHAIENHNGMRRVLGGRGGGSYSSTQHNPSALHHQSSGSDSGSSSAGSHSPPRPIHAHRTYHNFSAAYRPPLGYPHYSPANGEPPLYPPPYASYVQVPLYPPKMSCWNCGASGHTGAECKEPSIDEMGRPAVYQLDYAPPDINDK